MAVSDSVSQNNWKPVSAMTEIAKDKKMPEKSREMAIIKTSESVQFKRSVEKEHRGERSTPEMENKSAHLPLQDKVHRKAADSAGGICIHSVEHSHNRGTTTKRKRRSRWKWLRRRHLYVGVVQVDQQHPFFLLLKAISFGMHSLLDEHNRTSAVDHLHTEHFSTVIRKQLCLELEGEKLTRKEASFLFESYAPAAFATFRRAVSVNEEMYMSSIACVEEQFLEFISNSRSGQDFFFSFNMRFLIKTNRKRDIKFLLTVLGNYLNHFLLYPHSLLVKYLGCYSVKFDGQEKLFFLVMQNVFYPPNRIEDRFDLKGCTSGRYQKPLPPGSTAITVLKDQNFLQDNLRLGTNRAWFISQITADATFLCSLNVMDYSLLVGRQKMQESDREHSLPDLVTRIKKSRVASAQSSRVDTTDSCVLPGMVESFPAQQSSSVGLLFPHSLVEGEEFIGNKRLRLLSGCPNALHVIDGPEYRYFVGIVDFLTRWTLRQKLARVWKEVKYGCGEHSTMPPEYYCQRFIAFFNNCSQ